MVEVYKPITGYEKLYEISNLGNVRSLDRYNTDKNGKKKFYPGKTLKFDVTKKNHTNYYRVTLCKNHKVSRYLVHRLVAQAFIPNLDAKPHVNHIDNNGTNNTASNLEWCTHSENMVHAQQQGRLFKAQSKGGKVLGNEITTRIQNKITSLENSQVGEWEVGNFVGIHKATNGNNWYMFRCVCSCGYKLDIEMNRLLKKRTLNCRACAMKRNTLTVIETLVNSSSVFTGNYALNNERSPDKKFSVYEIVEPDGTTKYISYHLALQLIS